MPIRKAKKPDLKIPMEARASYACHIALGSIRLLLRNMPAIRVNASAESIRNSMLRQVDKLDESLQKDIEGYIKL